MKSAVGSVVIVVCLVGVVGWAVLARYRSELQAPPALDACALDEVACRSTPSGRTRHAAFPAREAQGDSRSADLLVSCVGAVWDVGIAFSEPLPSGWYAVGWESLAIASPPEPREWSAAGGFLLHPDPEAFVEAVLRPVPLSGDVAMAAFRVDPVVAFAVTRGSRFQALVAFDAFRVRGVVRALDAACGGVVD